MNPDAYLNYLVYLGIGQMRNHHTHLTLTAKRHPSAYNRWQLFRKGFLVAATNPKPILFFSAIFPLFHGSGTQHFDTILDYDRNLFGDFIPLTDDLRLPIHPCKSMVF